MHTDGNGWAGGECTKKNGWGDGPKAVEMDGPMEDSPTIQIGWWNILAMYIGRPMEDILT